MSAIPLDGIVAIALQGDFGTPRPALVIQSDRFDAHATVTVLLVSGTLVDAPLFRLTVEPSPENGLRTRSQIMVDKAMTVKRERIGPVIGRLEDDALVAVNRSLLLWIGLA
ncbi:type II toxin-antitoxin system PemK/MazF family toxin [Azospirillum sp. ST 5-10]|uniref:type II toxin-antitoxin system PemK/MazF family toxin n=1 Tax=unclassified Azospirillum TaxID=2630922 RepID=UPI003F49B9A7